MYIFGSKQRIKLLEVGTLDDLGNFTSAKNPLVFYVIRSKYQCFSKVGIRSSEIRRLRLCLEAGREGLFFMVICTVSGGRL